MSLTSFIEHVFVQRFALVVHTGLANHPAVPSSSRASQLTISFCSVHPLHAVLDELVMEFTLINYNLISATNLSLQAFTIGKDLQ